MYINIVTIICFITLSIEALYILGNVAFKERKQKIIFVRGFKKGKFAIVYLTAIPLYFISYLNSGTNWGIAIFKSIHKIINLIVLKYETEDIATLMQANELYKITVYFCFVLVLVNTIMLTLSLTIQHIWCRIQAIKAIITWKDKLYLFGNNPQNVAIYNSDGKTRNKVIVDNISDSDCEKLYLDEIAFISSISPEDNLKRLLAVSKKKNREHVFIINTGDEEKNIMLCTAIVDEIASAPEKIQGHLFLKLKVYVFGDPRYQAIYEDIIASGYGCIHYVSKYQKMAIDFIDRYPLALFMNENHIDYKTSLVKSNVNVNVALIGFGQTNQHVFLTSVANNQFLTEGQTTPVLKPVNYFIFDKNPARNNKNLNHSYYRFKNELYSPEPNDDYLPFPALPATETYIRLDINSKNFYEKIRNTVASNPGDANFIVIAFGTDLENLDMAQKLVEKRKEWNAHNLVIFVKVRVWHKEQTLLEDKGCYFIGNENDAVYDINRIMEDKLFLMAMKRNDAYEIERKIRDGKLEINADSLREQSKTNNENWFKSKSQMERDSSLFSCLSLRSKLNLMNLDYCSKDVEGVPALSEEEYFKIYAHDDMPVVSEYSDISDGKRIIKYGLEVKNTRRGNMAIHEHQRWNSFMISRGIVPATKDQILTEKVLKDGELKYSNGRNYAVRRHGNLTTYEGLIRFRKMIAEREKISEEQADVIRFDYQILDDAYWLLSTSGYKIIHKKSISE